MKYNRFLLPAVLLAAMFSLCGCADVKNMTEEEADMVAEYSAGVLLRYSETYPWRLVSKEQREETQQDSTAAPVPTATPAGDMQATPGAVEAADEGAGGNQPDGSDAQEVALDDVYHIDGVSVRFVKAWSCKRYKNIQVPIDESEKLVVALFQLRNTSSKEKKVSLMKRQIDYPLNINGAEYQLGISILEGNDMKYLNTTIAPGKKITAALVYNVPASAVRSVSQASLTVKENGSNKQATYDINLSR